MINYIIYTQSGFDKIDEMKSFKSMLSPSLNTEVVREIFASVKPIFEGISENLIDYVLEKITTVSSPPENEIVRQGQAATGMYFLSTGEWVVIVKDHKKVFNQERVLKPGDFFGELALISNNKRTATVKSLNYWNWALLSREDFQDFCIFFPAVLNRLKKKISTYNDNWRIFQKKILRNVDFFNRLDEPTIDELSLTFRDKFYEKDSYAFESGEPVDSIIFVLHGELELIVKMDNGTEKVIDTLFQGCHVGAYSMIWESVYNFYGRARTNVQAYTLSRESIEEFRKVLVDLDDEVAFFERYSEANGIPVWDYKFFFEEIDRLPSIRERFWQAVRRLLIINEYKRTKKFRLSEMIGKLRSKMEEERKKIEIKKQKEGFFCDEVNDILTKYIIEKLRINSGMVELFSHATELDKKSNEITKLYDERDKLIRSLTTNLYLLVEDIKKSEYLSGEVKKEFLARSETLFNLKDSDASVLGSREVESLKSNLDTFKINEMRRISEGRKSIQSATISPEEMTKLKNRLVTMIKSEQEDSKKSLLTYRWIWIW